MTDDAGMVTGVKSEKPEALFLRFPDDPSVYWFAASDVKKWLLPVGHGGPAAAARTTGGSRRGHGALAAGAPPTSDRPSNVATHAAAPGVFCRGGEWMVLRHCDLPQSVHTRLGMVAPDVCDVHAAGDERGSPE